MKKTPLIFLIFIILTGTLTGQHMRDSGRNGQKSRFFGTPVVLYDFYQFRSLEDDTRSYVDIHVGFCNDILQFVKENASDFRAEYELMIAVFDRKGNHMGGKTFSGNIVTQTFAETNQKNISNRIRYGIHLIPGKHSVIIELTDMDNRKSLRREAELEVPGFQVNPVNLSSIFLSSDVDTIQNHAGIRSTTPDINRVYNDINSNFWACFEIYTSNPDDQITFSCQIEDISKRLVVSNSKTIDPDSAIMPVIINLRELVDDANKYKLTVTVAQSGVKREQSISFSSNWRYFESTQLNVNRAIEPLKEFVSKDTWDVWTSAPEARREFLFDNYWSERDPTPDTEANELMDEFYRRVDFVNYNFSVNGIAKTAWETDRGKVYMKYGSPSNVERFASDMNIPPYEIWFYAKINRKFVFEDRNGNGEFMLVKVE
ncbi:MAG: GWxTD domain-containing protein [candidate division KSB1 bacterium]|nr:GWxTD domain-containing protein [candidate division KSB1 bacterium]